MDTHPVTVVVTRRARADRLADFEAWLAGINGASTQFPGHLGLEVVLPTSADNPTYHLIFRFASRAHLAAWEASDVRRDWLAKVAPLMDGEAKVEVVPGLEYWFTPPAGAQPPPTWKMDVATWVAIVPLAAFVPPVVSRALGHPPSLVTSMVANALLVPVMTWVAMPIVTRLLRSWLYRPGR